ncbi:MAG: hypothetical protein ABSC90_07245 [Acidimicrobiales bacterium]|jgi:hypothetical protein
MASRAVAGTDGWLELAEAVLQDQSERSLSPSSVPPRGQDRVESTIPLAEFEEGLMGLLGTLCERPGRWILIVEDSAQPNHFWQALAYEDGSLVAEIVSNFYLTGDDRLSPTQEDALIRLGWKGPEPPNRPNWLRVEPTTTPAVAEVASQAVRSLREVFGLGDEDGVLVKLFSSPHRANTPASPEYVEDTLEGVGGLIDPSGGPDEEDPDLYPDPTADDPPWGDE